MLTRVLPSQLIAVSVLTLASFLVTSALHYNRTPKPKTNAYINAFLSILWMLGFALLAWNLSGLLSHQCTIDNWTSDLGVMVCRIYKALMSFAVIGMITTLLALTLDILTHRQSAQLGAYNSMGGASARVSIIKTPLQAFSDLHSDPAMDSPYREPDLEIPEFSHDMKKPYKTQRPIEVAQFGYAAPSEQTSYGGAYSGFEHEKEDGDLGMGMAALGRGYSDREGV
ncbi:hypothetical protein MMC19_000330 [Ptychographa xylographoides]|nr:hypothetical protein [Ptychographa xylographoides]